jgi:hypothetical protein
LETAKRITSAAVFSSIVLTNFCSGREKALKFATAGIMSAVCTLIQGLSGQKDDWPALLQQIEQQSSNIRSTDIDGILAQLTLPLHTIGVAVMLCVIAMK